MKKFLLIMITVLTVISLVACSASGISEEEAEKRTQAKLDEAAETYGEFIKYRLFLQNGLWRNVLSQYSAYSETPLENATITGISGGSVANYAEYMHATDEYKISGSTTNSKFVEGTTSGTYTDATISNVRLTATYEIINRADGTSKTVKDEEIVISKGAYTATTTGTDSNYTQTLSISTTINGTEYSISYTKKYENGTGGYTAASVNGKEVSTKFLKALDTYGNTEWY